MLAHADRAFVLARRQRCLALRADFLLVPPGGWPVTIVCRRSSKLLTTRSAARFSESVKRQQASRPSAFTSSSVPTPAWSKWASVRPAAIGHSSQASLPAGRDSRRRSVTARRPLGETQAGIEIGFKPRQKRFAGVRWSCRLACHCGGRGGGALGLVGVGIVLGSVIRRFLSPGGPAFGLWQIYLQYS